MNQPNSGALSQNLKAKTWWRNRSNNVFDNSRNGNSSANDDPRFLAKSKSSHGFVPNWTLTDRRTYLKLWIHTENDLVAHCIYSKSEFRKIKHGSVAYRKSRGTVNAITSPVFALKVKPSVSDKDLRSSWTPFVEWPRRKKPPVSWSLFHVNGLRYRKRSSSVELSPSLRASAPTTWTSSFSWTWSRWHR